MQAKTALSDAKQGTNGGVRGILDAITEVIKRDNVENWPVPSLAYAVDGIHSGHHMNLRNLVGVHVFEEDFLEFMLVVDTPEKFKQAVA